MPWQATGAERRQSFRGAFNIIGNDTSELWSASAVQTYMGAVKLKQVTGNAPRNR